MRRLLLVLSVVLLTLPIAGCWDRKEVNDLALVMAKGIDLMDDNQVRVSVQIAIPSKVGGSQSGSGKGEGGKSFLVVSGIGRTVSEADTRIQEKLPRQLYLPHLRVILVGDRMAKSGLEQILDHFGRNPPNRLRTTILVAKNSDALSYMTTTYPLESISGEAIRKLERQLIGSNTTLMDFLIQAASDGTDQFSSAISLLPSPQGEAQSTQSEDPYFTFKNLAVFKNLKLVGYLNMPESIALEWLNKRLKHITLTTAVPKTKGTISVELTRGKLRAKTFVAGNKIVVNYELSGSALLTENSTGLDADDPETIKMFQSAINQYVEQTTKACLTTLNTTMDADAAGIGRMIYHQHPYDWERLKEHWHEELKHVRTNVMSQVKIVENGKSGGPLYTKTHRGILRRDAASDQVEGGQQ